MRGTISTLLFAAWLSAPNGAEPINTFPIRLVMPTYPSEMAAGRIEHAFSVTLEIDEDGRVIQAKPVERMTGFEWFESSAVGALRQWQFRASGQHRQQLVHLTFKIFGDGPRDAQVVFKGNYEIEVRGTSWKRRPG